MSDLLSCPFCGSPAQRCDVPADIDDDNAGASYIECTKCSACTALHFDRKENLERSWNDRAYLRRESLARHLAMLDGVTLYDPQSTFGAVDNSNNWRKYLERADDLLAAISEEMSHD